MCSYLQKIIYVLENNVKAFTYHTKLGPHGVQPAGTEKPGEQEIDQNVLSQLLPVAGSVQVPR